jgi:hypothetical protein
MRTAAPSPSPLRILVAAASLLALAGPVAAQPKVRIASARVGLPPLGETSPEAGGVTKFAAWAPVYVELELLAEVTDPAELVVETPDADGVTTSLAVPLDLATVRPGTVLHSRDLRLMPYLRPAAGTGETTVTVRTAGGAALSEPFRIRSLRPRDPRTYVVLALGSRLPGFQLPRPSTAAGGGVESAGETLRGGHVELAAITDVGQLPDHWIGYDGADLVVLTTGSEEFVKRLFDDKAAAPDRARRAALLEWVNRGGRLVVSVGANASLVASLPALQAILPRHIRSNEPSRQVTQLPLYWSARETSQSTTINGNLTAKGGPFPVANFAPRPDHPGRVVVPPPSRQADEHDTVAVQSGSGLGRITLIGFDLDRPPFTDFGMRAEFWDWVLREGGANRASVGSEGKPQSTTAGPTDEEDEAALALRTHVDTFDGIPVVSFGYVAFLIGLYILLIGPLEYYFLKRVFGRLELTWLTFPVIVLTICVAAYLTAAAVKGRELRVNKVDVVDVVADFDPKTGKPSGTVYGTSWFTVFSPRIDAFTIGVTPAPGWTGGEAELGLVGWLGGPRSGRASLLRRRYGYHVDPPSRVADGLDGVPIQVWSTKSFTARWTGPIDPAAPVVESRLEHPPGDPTRAIGTFVNRMPFDEVTDCVAFYAGFAHPIGTVLSGQEVRLVLDRGQQANQWLQERGQLTDLLGRVPAGSGPTPVPNQSTGSVPTIRSNALPLWGVLFHEAALRNDEGVIPRNASLRRLDQSWRLAPDNRDEVIVVGRVAPKAGPLEGTVGGKDSPSRVWLKGLPGQQQEPAAVAGRARQETYVRLYLPVLPAGKVP